MQQSHSNTSTSKPGCMQGTRYPLANYLSYDKLSLAHLQFISSVSNQLEPETYAQTIGDPK